ncbi:DUF4393 domain-containing protein [Latilactobacillus sakei]|uniref:DUF4393 domain-containing protein n=1 Tax=Latilactobacillus sakei TaxID=1599 RepID=UPI003884D8CB
MNLDPNSIDALSKAIPESTKEQLLNPTANNIGKSIGGISRFLLTPLLKLDIITQKNLYDFESEIYAKTDAISLKNRDSSKLGLALKTIEDSKYQLDSKDLRELFVNLIASTVDKEKNNKSHPRFSTILSEMDNNDAVFLKNLIDILIANGQYKFIPTCQLENHNNKTDGRSAIGELQILSDSKTITNNISLTNLSSLGIIEVKSELQPYNEFYSKQFDNFENSIEIKNLKNKISEQSDHSLFILKGHIKFTELGTRFIELIS